MKPKFLETKVTENNKTHTLGPLLLFSLSLTDLKINEQKKYLIYMTLLQQMYQNCYKVQGFVNL